ncbi:YpmS family protein [Alkalihalobacillus sp. MEB130]|uniref:YpmS family protein n=1 Tax=Alkalihalobacillus sp. MEB130 TaxID=2976704 RepID=UPI0028DDF205|nr:YpmS family protein [Alkalihalobacillus sp. MEB130]MDT8862023.1 YpmS family protein [Alkalihalobacillus sp. MEB130]
MMKRNDSWKIAFLSLLGLVIVSIVVVFMLFQRYFPEVEEHHFSPKEPVEEEATFLIQTNKSRLNAFLSLKIEEDASDIPYIVELIDDRVQFRSAFRVLGQEVPVTINFLPSVAPNGDLLLEVTTFSLGILQLPVDQVMQLLSNWLELAEWIVIYPSEKMVEVKVTEIEVDETDSMKFRFVTFDLDQDRIELEMIFK